MICPSVQHKSSYPKVPTTFRISVSIPWIILFCNNKPSHQTVAKDWPLLSLSFFKIQINYILFILKFTSDYTFVLNPITHHHTQQLINFPDWNTCFSPHLLAIKSCFWISVIKLKFWKSETSSSTCNLNVYETFFQIEIIERNLNA